MKIAKKYIKQYDKTTEFERRLSAWRTEHNTTAAPHASALGLKCVAHSEGYEGITGTLFIDTKTGEYIGVPSRGVNIYMM